MNGLAFLVLALVAVWVVNLDEAPPLPHFRGAMSRAFRAVATRRDMSRHDVERGVVHVHEIAPGVHVDTPDRSRQYVVAGRDDVPATDLDRWVCARIEAGHDRTSTAKKASARFGVSLRHAQRACTRALGGDA